MSSAVRAPAAAVCMGPQSTSWPIPLPYGQNLCLHIVHIFKIDRIFEDYLYKAFFPSRSGPLLIYWQVLPLDG